MLAVKLTEIICALARMTRTIFSLRLKTNRTTFKKASTTDWHTLGSHCSDCSQWFPMDWIEKAKVKRGATENNGCRLFVTGNWKECIAHIFNGCEQHLKNMWNIVLGFWSFWFGSKSTSLYETLFAAMVLGVSRIGSTDPAQSPIWGCVCSRPS